MTKIKIRSAKAKGRNLQQWVCKKLSKILKESYDNKDDNASIASRQKELPSQLRATNNPHPTRTVRGSDTNPTPVASTPLSDDREAPRAGPSAPPPWV